MMFSILSQISKNNVKKDYLLKPGDIVIIRPEPKRNNTENYKLKGMLIFLSHT